MRLCDNKSQYARVQTTEPHLAFDHPIRVAEINRAPAVARIDDQIKVDPANRFHRREGKRHNVSDAQKRESTWTRNGKWESENESFIAGMQVNFFEALVGCQRVRR